MDRRVLILIVDIVAGVLVATGLLFAVRGCQPPTMSTLTPSQAVSPSAPVNRPIAVAGLVGHVDTSGDDKATLVLTDPGRDPAASRKLAVIYVGPMPKPIADGATATFYGSLTSDKVLHAEKYTIK